jgi:hypothetical protein
VRAPALRQYRAAERRILASIFRRDRGLEWHYEGREDDLERIRR